MPQMLLDKFKSTLKDSNLSELEMSFNFNCTPDEFKLIMDGHKAYTEAQELVMLRFLFKQGKGVRPVIIPNHEVSVIGMNGGESENNTIPIRHSGLQFIIAPSGMYKQGTGAIFMSPEDYELYKSKKLMVKLDEIDPLI